MNSNKTYKGRIFAGALAVLGLCFGTTGVAIADSTQAPHQNAENDITLTAKAPENNAATISDERLYSEITSAISDDVAQIEDIVEDNDVVVVVDSALEKELMWSDDCGRSISAVNGGFHLTLADGDYIDVAPQGDTAIWYRQDGLALIEFDVQVLFENGEGKFLFNSTTGLLTTVVRDDNSTGLGIGKYSAAKKRCAPKWVAAGWNILWDGLVCLPVGVGTAAVGGFICGAAGTAISTAISC